MQRARLQHEHRDLPVGLGVATAIVLAMLGLRSLGGSFVSRDPDCTRWTGVFGRVLQKTKIFFMVAAALDVVTTYSAVPQRLERLIDILFVVAFTLQGAIWARELILGSIGRRVSDDGESTLANAQALIRVLVSSVCTTSRVSPLIRLISKSVSRLPIS